MYTKTISGFGVQLKPLEKTQLEQVRLWRNHPEISAYMFEQHEITENQQKQWFESLSEKNDVGVWLAFYRDEALGVINVKADNGVAVEQASLLVPGLYMAPESRYRNSLLAFCPSLALIEHFFSGPAERMQAQVKSTNNAALRYNQTLGYQVVNTNNNDFDADIVIMELDRASFQQAKEKLQKIIRF